MRNAQVIEFPKAQSVRKRLQDKAQEQKSVLILSIASVLVLMLFLNQWLAQGPEVSFSEQGSRSVASFDSTRLMNDVRWEHDLAQRMASDGRLETAQMAEVPTVRDELVFGFLEGKYGMKLEQGRIESLEFIDAQAGEQPLTIQDKADFLKKYSEAFGRNFSEVSLAANSQGEQVFSLINPSKEIVGKARFMMDEQGRVQAIQFLQ